MLLFAGGADRLALLQLPDPPGGAPALIDGFSERDGAVAPATRCPVLVGHVHSPFKTTQQLMLPPGVVNGRMFGLHLSLLRQALTSLNVQPEYARPYEGDDPARRGFLDITEPR